MQNTSNLWKQLAASGGARMETSVTIGTHTYAPESVVEVSRAIGQSALSVGNCVTATVLFSIRPIEGVEISAGAAAAVKCRFTDGQRESEWATMGTFYVSRRTDYPTNGLLEFEGYDAMQKANAPYPNLSGFPKAMNSAVSEIARNMGVEVDARTWDGFPTGAEYYVPLPAENEKMIGVLSYIGGVCGGNWVITPQNRLRFVPLASASGAASASDKADVVGILGGITVGESATVTGAATVSERKEMLEGDDSGAVIRAPSNPYFTRALLESLLTRYRGISYVPFEIQRAIYDPAMEIGDYIVRCTNVSGVSREHIASVVWQESARYGPAFRGDLSAPFLSVAGTQSLSETIDIAGDNYSDLSLRFYKFTNNESVIIGGGESADIINLDFGAGAKQDVIFHAEVKHTTATAETGNAVDGWTCTDAVLTVTYYINDAEVTAYYPVQTETDGVRLLHLNYQFENGRYTIGNFRAVLSVSGGTVSMNEGDVRAYIIGQGYTGAYFDTDAAHDLQGILITSYPEKYYYYSNERLDFEGLAIKAQYRNGDEKTVTEQCVLKPDRGETLEHEGGNTVVATYAENDTKPFTAEFDVCLLPENGGLMAIKITSYPYTRTYETGDELNLSGVAVTAYYGDGTTENVTNKEDCVFTVRHEDSEDYDAVFSLFTPSYNVPLTDGKTNIIVTYQGRYVGNFYVFCGAGDWAWIANPPDKLTYYIGERLDLTGVVIMARENGEETQVTGGCTFDPANRTKLELGDTTVMVSYQGVELDDSFLVTCKAGDSEHGWLIWARIAKPPTKQKYLIDVEGENTLILDGVVVMALYGDKTEKDVTNNCSFTPDDGAMLKEGYTKVNVAYQDANPMSFTVYCGKASGGWITENGLVFVGVESYPEKMDGYNVGDALDLTGLVVKAYYGNGAEKDITANCSITPGNGDMLEEEGEIVVNISYVEGGKEFHDSFPVYCEDGYAILYIEALEKPNKTEYYQGDTLDLKGLVIGAFQKDGHIVKNIKPQCAFNPAEGATLSTSGTVTVTVTRTFGEALGGGTFTTYFDVNVIAVKARGDGWILLEDGTLIIDSDNVDWDTLLDEIAPYIDDITRIIIRGDTPIPPEILAELIEMLPNLEEIVLPPGVDLEEIQALIDSLTVIQIASYPLISDYAVNETLDYTGLQVVKTLPGGTTQDITAECEVRPEDGKLITEVGDIYVDVRHEDKSIGSFWVGVSEASDVNVIAEGDGWRLYEDGTLHIYLIGPMPDYLSSRTPWSVGDITNVVIDNGLTSIGNYAFYGCINLTSVTIPDSVTSIREYAFAVCESLADLTIPNGVTSIGNHAFDDCVSLTSVTIPNSVMSIGEYAFFNCTLTNVTIGNSVTSIGEYAFSDATLASVTIPSSVTNMRYAFGSALNSVTIQSGATTISEYAFDDCVSLTSVTIPSSVTSIGESAFGHCYVLEDVYYSGTEEQWNEIDISIYNEFLYDATIHYNSAGPT